MWSVAHSLFRSNACYFSFYQQQSSTDTHNRVQAVHNRFISHEITLRHHHRLPLIRLSFPSHLQPVYKVGGRAGRVYDNIVQSQQYGYRVFQQLVTRCYTTAIISKSVCLKQKEKMFIRKQYYFMRSTIYRITVTNFQFVLVGGVFIFSTLFMYFFSRVFVYASNEIWWSNFPHGSTMLRREVQSFRKFLSAGVVSTIPNDALVSSI